MLLFYNFCSLKLCITSPCQNGATCKDINTDTFTCNCIEGWTGHYCNETVTSTVTWLSTTSLSTTTTTDDYITTVKTMKLTTIISSTSPTASSEITKTNATVAANNTKLYINSSALTSKGLLAIYISAPLGFVIAVIGVITFLIIRKRRNQKKDDTCAIYSKSDEATHTCTISYTAYTDQNIQPDIALHANLTAENKAVVKTAGTIEVIDNQYETTNADIHKEIHLDENGYGHLMSKVNAVLFDTTYSHMKNLHYNNTHDNTYSHLNKATETLQSDVILNDADADDTYSHINRPAGKLKPDLNLNTTDDTYNTLNNNGTTMNQQDRIGNQTEMVQNDPEYDHIK